MGEVYRAQDTELGRSVALKFLPADVVAHPSRVNRFIQEAKAASSLNHPNILTVYEIGRDDNATFIATEFVDGVTLRQHLHHPLKLIEVLDIAIQVTSALVAAHAAGIVHRDIKPENIMVRKDGIVKVLDFGLAKLAEKQDTSSAGSEAPTMALVHTEPGAVLGTVAYMSPEQAAGREVDARSDIWSLGIVLYEMLTSRVPFEGASKSHIIVAIIDREPLPVSKLAQNIPEALEWIVSEALTKDPEERTQTAKELLGKLKRLKQRIETGDSQMSSAPVTHATMGDLQTSTAEPVVALPTREVSGIEVAPARRNKLKKASLVVLGAIVLVASAIGYRVYVRVTEPGKQLGPVKMTALTTGGRVSGDDINGQLSISPDGKYVVFAANDTKQQASLWLRQISTNSLVRIVPPENGGYVATTFSPDGEMIYYVAVLERDHFVPSLYRVPVLGGTPSKILDRVSSAIGFSRDGTQFAFLRQNENDTALIVANTDGSGDPRTIATVKPPSAFSLSGPSWSPDGKRIACGMFNGGAGYSTVVEVPATGGEPQPLGSQKWARVGRVIWLGDDSGLIMTAQPESSSLGTQIWFLPTGGGEPRRITNDLDAYGDVSLGLTSDSKTIATVQQVTTSSISITAPNEAESRAQQIVKTSLPETVRWTPDGKIIYAMRTGENWDIWLANADGSETKQLTADAFIDQQPSMCGDGRYIVFQSNRAHSSNIWRMNPDGTNVKQLTFGTAVDSYPVCSPDGQSLVFFSMRSGEWRGWRVGINGGEPGQVTNGASELPFFSPDGQQIAYFYRDEQANKQRRVGIVPLSGGAPVKTIALPWSVQPIAFAWLPDGKSIAYLDSSAGVLNIWSAPLDGGQPKQLTNFNSGFIDNFDIFRDGRIAAYRFNVSRDIVLIKDFR